MARALRSKRTGTLISTPNPLRRARLLVRALLLSSLLVLALAGVASAADAAPTGATGATDTPGTVNQLGADPTVRIAKRRHCVRSKLIFSPRYTGGGGVRRTYLYVNGELVAQRWSDGLIRLSARHLERGVNSYELVSEFEDGRAASAIGNVRRCGGR